MLSEKFTRMDDETISTITDLCGHTYKKCKPYFKNTRVALDVGSKSGNFAKHMCVDFDFVHMFDMRPKLIKANHTSLLKATLHKCALGDRNGEIEHAGALTNVDVNNVTSVWSPVRTIDSFDFDDIDFIKIDVEGDERAVLQGAVNTLDKHKPVVVLEQNHSTEQYGKGKYGDAVHWLEKNSYKIIDYDGIDDWIMIHV